MGSNSASHFVLEKQKFTCGTTIILDECLKNIIDSYMIQDNYPFEHVTPYCTSVSTNVIDRNLMQIIFKDQLFNSLNSLYNAFIDNNYKHKKKVASKVPDQISYTIVNLYKSYYLLSSSKDHLEKINIDLIKKLKQQQNNSPTSQIKMSLATCSKCSQMEKSLTDLQKKYDEIHKDRDKMVVRYAGSEKSHIDAQRSIKSLEKKLHENISSRETYRKKNEQLQDRIIKLAGEINGKNSEITTLRNQIEHQKDKLNTKDLQLQWKENRLKHFTHSLEETDKKLNDLIVEYNKLKTKYETLLLEHLAKSTSNDVNAMRNFSDNSNASPVKLVSEGNEMQNIDLKENDSTSQNSVSIENLYIQCGNYVAQINDLQIRCEKQSEEIQMLTSTLYEKENICKEVELMKSKIEADEVQLQQVNLLNSELQADKQDYKQRLMELLDFTQKLTDKNVQLQCENQNLSSHTKLLEAKQENFYKTVITLLTEKKDLENNLAIEKSKFDQLWEFSVHSIAKLLLDTRQLTQLLSDLRGEYIILQKKCSAFFVQIKHENLDGIIKIH
ncbi:coiled-coil domain-containing protein 186-like [Trichogramma pretiosum]|uniref:coiled-coil domain-containing protein 186-like n=1 Tax=Trichogramma pretiosum TaxID=7493 RepID=UPI000C719C6B|nr:coiled-coil domain-containing protein 186-like [Trichogramma pretiosum]